MPYKILFLGTRGSDAIFQKQGNSAGIVLILGNYQLIIDPGPGTLLKAQQYNVPLSHTNIILVSHNHIAHCNDLNILIEAMTHSGLEKRGILIADEATIHGTDLEKPYLTNKHRKYLEKYIAVSAGDEIKFDEIRIRALKTKHSEPHTIGYKIFTEKFVLTYTSDTKYFNELSKEYEETDVLISNNVHPSNSKSDNNLTSDDTLKIIEKVKPSLTILTHFGKKLSSDSAIYEARNMKRQLDSKLSVISAREGVIIDPISYSAELKQKTLMGFKK